MANYLVSDTQLTGIANAIRAKSGGTSPLAFPDGFTSEVSGLMTLDDIEAVVDYRTDSESVHFGTSDSGSRTLIEKNGVGQLYIAHFDVEEGMLLPKSATNMNKFFSAEVTTTNLHVSGRIKYLDPVISRTTGASYDRIWVGINVQNVGNSFAYLWGDENGYATISVRLKFLNTILTASSDEEEIPVGDETIIP